MEARSLSSLNVLATNPPQYPERPHEEKQEPLVLYISRVPGTRDVILSPLKPQAKNVTGGDVSTCLYYVHLELPCSSGQTGTNLVRKRSSQDSTRLAIPRKPVPESARPLTPDSMSGPVNAQSPAGLPSDSSSPLTTQAKESPTSAELPSLNNNIQDGSTAVSEVASQYAQPSAGLSTSMPTRKPVAPRIITELPSPPSGKGVPAPSSNEAVLMPTPDSLMDSKAPRIPLSPIKPRRTSSPSSTPFTLTLIRRDPSSGSQWNVGRVKSRQLDTMLANDGLAITSPSSPPPIGIEIETSGYAKFRRPAPWKSAQGGTEAAIPTALGDEAPRNDASVFTRRAVMECSKSWTSTLKDRLQRLEQAGRYKIKHARNGSIASLEAWAAAPPSRESPALKPRGYTFTSPWDGKCEFRTGNGGRSVQCRHVPGESAALGNPLPSERTGGSLWTNYSTPVSDLRFNLPTVEVLGEHARTAKEEWRGNFSKLLNTTGRDEGAGEHEDAVSPFDVNVGLERAGGGNRGSKAKLGKLVVYHEGLKMLDLVVAANMGVWWGTWEKMF